MKGGYCRSSRGRKERAVVLVVVIMNVVRAGALLSHNNSCARYCRGGGVFSGRSMACRCRRAWPCEDAAVSAVKRLSSVVFHDLQLSRAACTTDPCTSP